MGPQNSIFRTYDFGKLLDRKYRNMEASTAAQTTGANATMLSAQTDRLGMPSTIAQREALTAGQNLTNEFFPAIAGAELDQSRAVTRNTNATAAGTEAGNRTGFGLPLMRTLFPGLGLAGGAGSTLAQNQFRFGAGVAPSGRQPSLSMGEEDYDPLRR